MGRAWYWIGFSDASRPRGSQALGAIVVQATSIEGAVWDINQAGLHPGGEAMGGEMPADLGAPPQKYVMRLLDNAQAEELLAFWDPQNAKLATAEEIREAVLDPDAKVGEPLFKGRG